MADAGSEFGITPDTKPVLNLDALGIFWMTFAGVWTWLLACGILYLCLNRRMAILRIRGLALSFSAVLLLHFYWFTVQFVYVFGAVIPEQAEFWIMSIWLPFGIALFQVSNSRFLHVAEAQRRFLRPEDDIMSNDSSTEKGRTERANSRRSRGLGYSKKMLVIVMTGTLIQLLLTIVMYLVSRKFHSSFGIPGTEVHGTHMEQKVQQGRGWEWWPSLFWQFFWSWVVAPIILWRARGISDTLGWRVQTIGCCLAGLHATPMWLVALYVPGMGAVNKYFVPPQWIAISIMVLEVFTICIPCGQVMQHKSMRQITMQSIEQWESDRKRGGQHLIPNSSHSIARPAQGAGNNTWEIMPNIETGCNLKLSRCLSMSALEYTLRNNPEPLRRFAALRDFSGENVAFLLRVAEWKASLPIPATEASRDMIREKYYSALRLYIEFVSPRDTEFSINLGWQDLRGLEEIFENAARIGYGGKSDIDPIAPFEGSDDSSIINLTNHSPSQARRHSTSFGAGKQDGNVVVGETIGRNIRPWADIPESFDGTVFDSAEKSIKYLVLTNTWPKYLKESHQSTSWRGPTETINSDNAMMSLSSIIVRRF